MVCLTFKESNKKTTVSYARYLLSCLFKRFLNKEEQVDHIDGDKTNDNIENLQILSGSANVRKHIIQTNRGHKIAVMECPTCKTVFERAYNKTHFQKKGHYSACSRDCSYAVLKLALSIEQLKNIGNSQLIEIKRKEWEL